MRGRGVFQIAQMKHRDPRIGEFCRHLRAAIDVREDMALRPYQPPEPPAPEPVAKAPPPAPPPPPVIPTERITYTVKDAAAAIGISRTTIWAAISDGRLAAYKLGQRTLIPAESLRAWVSTPRPTKRKP